MRAALRGLTLLACAAALNAPAQQAAAPAQQAGLETAWDIGVVLTEIGAHATRLLPLLDRADASAWQSKGASDAYAAQLQSGKDQARAIADAAKTLARDPEKLSASLELFFRIQSLDTTLGSVAEALRKYQSPEDAQALVGLSAESGANRDRFQRYIVNLAAEREKEFIVMDKEAQRCRGILTAPPTSGRKK